ncbi:MAG: hypothetical protein ABIH23_19850 [bacterium]
MKGTCYFAIVLSAAVLLLSPSSAWTFGEDTPDVLALYSPESQGLIPFGDAIMVDDPWWQPSRADQESQMCVITSSETVAYSAHRIGGCRMYTIDMVNIPWKQDYDGTNWAMYFNDDGTPLPYESVAYGAKTKANIFGPGWGVATYAYDVHPDSLAIAVSAGHVPLLQLFQDDGTPIVPVRCLVPEDFAAAPGDIRVGDWEFLSNGNIVSMGESRQIDENINLFGVAEDQSGNVLYLSIMKPDEQFPSVHFGRLSEEARNTQTWHGLGVTQNGFAARFDMPGVGPNLRFFQNDATPLTGDIPLSSYGEGELAGALGGGGRGDEPGWHGDGANRYIYINPDPIQVMPGRAPIAGVFDEDGDLIVGPIVVTAGPDGWTDIHCERIDAYLQTNPATGRFVCVWTDQTYLGYGADAAILMGRIFDADGTPLTKMMALDNHFDLDLMDQPGLSRRPRVYWRGNKIAVSWVTTNFDENPTYQMCTLRTFQFGEDVTAIEDFMLY